MSSPAESQDFQSSQVVKPLMGHRWYVYGHTVIDESGKKSPLFPIRKKISNWRSRSHIQTVMTAEDGSNLLYGLALDLDYRDASSQWKSRGKLDHKKMRSFLSEHYPILSRYLCTWTRSTGGKGLGVVLFIDPFLLNDKAFGVRFLAERVQRLLIEVLNSHDFGCDESASGLLRFTPNWRNHRILLHKDELTIRRVQRDNEPISVLRQVYNELRRASIYKAPTRAAAVSSGQRFAVKAKADEGLAKIYAHILDSEPETLTIQSSYSELSELSGLSVPSLRQHLSLASWLTLERVWGEGLRLTLNPSPELTERALSGPMGKVLRKASSSSVSEDWDLPDPGEVGDGERNNYLWRRAVLLRNEGYTLAEAISFIRDESRRFPGAKESRNCRKVESIVCSIFRHTREPQTTKRKIFPLEALTKSQSYVPHFASEPEAGELGKAERGEAVSSVGELLEVAKPRAQVENFEQLPVMVSEQGPFKEGGSGDLPPSSPSDEDVLAYFAGIIPPRRAQSGKTAQVLEFPKPETAPSRPETERPKAKVFQTLREARAANFKEIHPLDRFERTFERCLLRRTEAQILSALRSEEPRIWKIERQGGRYRAPEGPFKRLFEAFAIVPERMRRELLV